ncbi:MAG: hypothetical protein R2735_01365 [Microthrixaceae bacterium]
MNVKVEPISDQTGTPEALVIVVTDRTEQRLVQDRLEELRSTDPLTGLMTRTRTVETPGTRSGRGTNLRSPVNGPHASACCMWTSTTSEV